MLGLGLSEILMVAAVMLVVVGPERLPQVFRQLGKIYGQVRRASDEMRRAFVLEADRQDAEERFEKLQERREKAKAAREAAMKAAGGNSVPADTGPEAPEATAPSEGELASDASEQPRPLDSEPAPPAPPAPPAQNDAPAPPPKDGPPDE